MRPCSARLQFQQVLNASMRFQPTRPRGVRLAELHGVAQPGPFSTHAPVQGATPRAKLCLSMCVVSTHAPTRGATEGAGGGRKAFRVSTHAPTRGATAGHASAEKRIGVSTHAPTRGATDQIKAGAFTLPVSTHAPTRGATRMSRWMLRRGGVFNPRAHAGRDESGAGTVTTSCSFQPTRPRGARRQPGGHQRHHEVVSTHAPMRPCSARLQFQQVLNASMRFQPTRPRGVRLAELHGVAQPGPFSTHAPVQGATPRAKLCLSMCAVSTHAPTRGATEGSGW